MARPVFKGLDSAMKSLDFFDKIFTHREPGDVRKSINGLSAKSIKIWVTGPLGEKPIHFFATNAGIT
jgi:hypothetical protein